MAIKTVVDPNLNRDDLAGRVAELKPKGFRLLSLSMYGDPKDARYAAVWDKRTGPEWEHAFGFTTGDLKKVTAENKARNFYPRLVAATGGAGPNCRMSATFEKLDPPKTRELDFTIGFEFFEDNVRNRRQNGWILVSAAVYDDATSAPIVAAVWGRNSANTAWTAFAETEADLQPHFDAEWAGWARLAFTTSSLQGKFVSLYRDDHVGQIGTGFSARFNMSPVELESQKAKWLKDKLHIICLQGSGLEGNRRFSAIAVKDDTLVQRVARASGGPVVKLIDDAVFDLMKRSNIRGAALAIVKGTKLVHARGYTWAEPDYPDVLPTTVFRLGSVSKVITALAIHQLVAQGRIKLSEKVKEVLPLTPPPNPAPPPINLPAANTRYLDGKVRQLIEKHANVSPGYANQSATVEIAEAFKKKFPVTYEQIARFWITKPLGTGSELKHDDFGYFLAGQIVKTQRNHDINLPMISAAGLITENLQINKPPTKRLRVARSRLLDQKQDDARYHSRDLFVNRSVMSGNTTNFGPLVPRGYGAENLELIEASGGLTAAVVDLARIMAAMNVEPYSPLGPAVKSMLKNAIDKEGGHGFDKREEIGSGTGKFAFLKGGLLETTQAGLYYSQDGCSYVVVWNGLHTGTGGDIDRDIEREWFPKFETVVTIANLRNWAKVDLFNQFGMDSFAPTQANFRHCKKCQGLFFAEVSLGSCPKDGGLHDKSASENYVLMHSAAFPYGEAGWLLCKKCQGLFFGAGSPQKCPSDGKKHQNKFNTNYSLLKDSPFDEPQRSWKRCKRCQGLFFQGNKANFCPATGSHDGGDSGDYSVAFK